MIDCRRGVADLVFQMVLLFSLFSFLLYYFVVVIVVVFHSLNVSFISKICDPFDCLCVECEHSSIKQMITTEQKYNILVMVFVYFLPPGFWRLHKNKQLQWKLHSNIVLCMLLCVCVCEPIFGNPFFSTLLFLEFSILFSFMCVFLCSSFDSFIVASLEFKFGSDQMMKSITKFHRSLIEVNFLFIWIVFYWHLLMIMGRLFFYNCLFYSVENEAINQNETIDSISNSVWLTPNGGRRRRIKENINWF